MWKRSLTAAVLLLAAGPARAAEWKSPDGNVAVNIPDPARFVGGRPDDEVLVSWKSRDGTVEMMVGTMSFPAQVRPRQANLELGMLAELNQALKGAKIVASSAEVRNGYDVFTMTAAGDQDGTTIYFTQTIAAFDGTAYKAAVIGFGKDTRTDPDATKFINSFRILAPPRAAPPPGVARPTAPGGEQKDPAYRIGFAMGQVAGVCVVLAVITWIVRRTSGRGGRSTRRSRDEDED